MFYRFFLSYTSIGGNKGLGGTHNGSFSMVLSLDIYISSESTIEKKPLYIYNRCYRFCDHHIVAWLSLLLRDIRKRRKICYYNLIIKFKTKKGEICGKLLFRNAGYSYHKCLIARPD